MKNKESKDAKTPDALKKQISRNKGEIKEKARRIEIALNRNRQS